VARARPAGRALGEERPSVRAASWDWAPSRCGKAMSEATGTPGRGAVEVTILFTDLVDFSSWALGAGRRTPSWALLREVASTTEPAIEDPRRSGGEAARRRAWMAALRGTRRRRARPAPRGVRGSRQARCAGYRPALARGAFTAGRPRKIGGDYVRRGTSQPSRRALAEAAKGRRGSRLGGPPGEELDETGPPRPAQAPLPGERERRRASRSTRSSPEPDTLDLGP